MGQLVPVPMIRYDEEGEIVGAGPIQLQPSTVRNGLVTLKGKEDTPLQFAPDSSVIVTHSVRQGRPADAINNIKRVKRKMVVKVRLPIEVPGVVSGQVANIVDYIDVDLTVATPVEASAAVLETALRSVGAESGIMSGWAKDMLLEGNEPF